MTGGEICRAYRMSKNKGAQIGVLADLNRAGREDIEKILLAGGESLPEKRRGRGKGGRRQKGEDTDRRAFLLAEMELLDAEIAGLEKRYAKIAAEVMRER